MQGFGGFDSQEDIDLVEEALAAKREREFFGDTAVPQTDRARDPRWFTKELHGAHTKDAMDEDDVERIVGGPSASSVKRMFSDERPRARSADNFSISGKKKAKKGHEFDEWRVQFDNSSY